MAILDNDAITVAAKKPALSAFDERAALNIPWQDIQTAQLPRSPKWYGNAALTDFLLASGAAMANSDTFLRGISAGANAGAQAVDARVERNKPRFEFLNNGRTLAKFDPSTGEYTYHDVDPVNQQLAGDDARKSRLRREEADHEFGNTVKRDETLHGYDIDKIEAQGENSKAVAQIGADASLEAARMRARTAEDRLDRNDPIYKARVKNSEQLLASDMKAYQKADENDQLLSHLDKMSKSRSIGGDAVTQVQRALSNITGADFMGVDPSDTAKIDAILGSLELVASGQLAGQGQITEGERAILRKSLPNISRDPQAFRDVIDILKARNTMAKERIYSYFDAQRQQPDLLYYDHLVDWTRGRDAEQAADAPKGKTFESGGLTVEVKTRG